MVIRIGFTALTLLMLAACIAGFLVRWPIENGRLRARAIRFIESSSGLTVHATGPLTLVVLPHPTVRLRDIEMHGLNGAISLDADAISGSLSLPALFTGRLRVAKTTLSGATIAVDMDRVLPLLTTMFAPLAQPKPQPDLSDGRFAFFHTDGLTIRSGTLRLRSNNPLNDALLTDINSTFEWPNDDSGASLVGGLTWHGEPTDISLLLDAPVAWIDGGSSQGYMRLKSLAADVTASGLLTRNGSTNAVGKISASTPRLPHFLRLIGTSLPQLGHIGPAQLSGDVTLADHVLAISNVQLGLDDMLFDGALAFHGEAGHPGIDGTLATDRINLDPFVEALPRPGGVNATWSTVPFETKSIAYDDIDLRISASKASFGRIEFEDGGLSLQSRDGRMEISLGEARAYDGLFKGRLIATLKDGVTEVRADTTISQLNLASLGNALDPALRITGTSSGHATLEGSGTSPADLVRSLGGHGQISLRDGQIGAGVMAWLSRATQPPADAVRLRLGDSLPFDSAQVGFHVNRGLVDIDEGWLLRPDYRALFGGSASLAQRSANFEAAVTPIVDDLQRQTGPSLGLRLTGPWQDLRLHIGVPDESPAAAAAAPPASR